MNSPIIEALLQKGAKLAIRYTLGMVFKKSFVDGW